MGTLQGFIDAVIAECRTVDGILYAPDDPPAELVKWPATPVWAVTGGARCEFGQTVTFFHVVRVGILGPIVDMTRVTRALTAQLEPIIQNIYGKYAAHGFTDIESMGDISYTFGPIDWAGVTQFGFILTIHDVEILNTTS